MQAEIIRLIKSDVPQDRINGIKLLAQSQHPDTIQILRSVYRQEDHPKVKEFAAKVARQFKAQEQEQVKLDPTVAELMESAPPAKRKPKQPEFKPQKSAQQAYQDRQDAKTYLDRAMSTMLDGKIGEAWEWGRKAFDLHPDYAQDQFAVNLAAKITGADPSIAVDELLNPEHGAVVQKAKRIDPTIKQIDDEKTWGEAFTSLGVYALFVGAINLFALIFFGASLFGGLGFFFIGFVYILVPISVIITFIGTLIMSGVVHLSAKALLGGNGYMTNLIINLRNPLMAYTGISILLTIIYSAALSSIRSIDHIITASNVMTAVNGIVSLGFIAWYATIVGDNYKFGTVRGFVALILAVILLLAAAFILSAILASSAPSSYSYY